MSDKCSSDSISAEYKMVRNEIDQKMSLHNTLLMFTITTTVAILAIAAGNEKSSPFLYLLPFCVILPMSNRIAYYRRAMAKLSAYLIVFCEDSDDSIKWETRNLSFFEQLNSSDRKFVLNYYECFILSIICYFLFLYNYVSSDANWKVIMVINCIWPIILIVLEYRITSQINRLNKDRIKLIKVWKKVKKNESTLYHGYNKTK